MVEERVATVKGLVVNPLYLRVDEVAFAPPAPLQTAPVPQVPVGTSVPKPEYPKYPPVEVATQVFGAPVW